MSEPFVLQAFTALAMADESSAFPSPIERLTSRMARGDEEAYREFYQLYGHRLFRYLIVVTSGQEESAKDALQQTLLRLVRHIRRFDSEDEFWSWLTVLARSAASDQRRKGLTYQVLLGRFFEHANSSGDRSEPGFEGRLNDALEASLNALPEEHRQLLDLKYRARASVKDLAAQLKTTEKSVESRLVRLRQRLRADILAKLTHEDAT